MDPVLGASLVSGGSSLFGSILGLYGQDRANKQNIAMQRETNAQNYKMFKEQLAFAKDQQDLALSYNDPSSQVARLRAAGVNPAAVFGNGSISEASMISPPSGNPMVAPHVQPLDYGSLGTAVAGGSQAYFDNQLKDAMTDKTLNESNIAQADAAFKNASLADRLAQIAADKERSQVERDSARKHLEILRHTQDALERQEELKADVLDRQVLNFELENDAKDIANRVAAVNLHWIGKEKTAQYALFMAQIKEALAAARAGDAQACLSYAAAALNEAKEAGAWYDAEVARRTVDDIVDKANNEKVKSYWDALQSKKEYKRGWFISRFFPTRKAQHIFDPISWKEDDYE